MSSERMPCYGAFPGGDPREFTPDPECSTPEERERWQLDCADAERGELTPRRGAHYWTRTSGGGVVHVAGSGYGLGTYMVDFEEEPE